MRWLLTILLAWAVYLVDTERSWAYLAGGDINLQLEILATDGQGAPSVLCQGDWIVESSVNGRWILTSDGSAPLGSESTSGRSQEWSCRGDQGAPIDSCARRSLSASLSAVVQRQMEHERIIVANLEVKPQSADCEEPTWGAAKEDVTTRQLYFSDDAEIHVPVHHFESRKEGDGQSVIFFRLVSRLQLPDRQTNLGTISLIANEPGATVFLDGGNVGSIPEEGVFTIGLVQPGLRTVTMQTGEGNERIRFVRTQPGRTHWLSFQDEYIPGRGRKQPFFEFSNVNSAGYREFKRSRDGATMIEVPEGEFLMGNQRTERSPHEHRVYLSTFLIDKLPVTWKRYKQFVASTGMAMPPHVPYWGIHDNHPAVYVTWEEARAYCQWAGGRLPTEAEREKAARGTDGRMYPWGEQPPAPELAVFRRTWGGEATDAVGLRPLGASPYGALDMGGNVWEWCSDWYSDDYLESSPYENPPGPGSGIKRVVRGGSWDSRPDVTSASCRNWGHRGYREGDFGFRCAMNAAPHR